MVRRIIHIDSQACNGCGACAAACHEGAIGMVDGKARLLREDYCDGLGDCLPTCPTGAITFVEREAPPYDEKAVLQSRESAHKASAASMAPDKTISQLAQWPCQLRLLSADSACFSDADLLIAADCTAYAYAGIHADYMAGRVTVIGCPKLDPLDYTETLTQILSRNRILRVTLLRMQVPCCGRLENSLRQALMACGKSVDAQVVTISTKGVVLDCRHI